MKRRRNWQRIKCRCCWRWMMWRTTPRTFLARAWWPADSFCVVCARGLAGSGYVDLAKKYGETKT